MTRESWADRPQDVLLEYCESNLTMFIGERIVNKLLSRSVMCHALGRVVIMHFEAKRGIGSRPTLTRLQRSIGLERTLAAFFAMLRVAGLVAVEGDVVDRRIKYLVPSRHVIEGLRGWLVVQLTYGERLGFIAPGYAARLQDDDAYAERFYCCVRHVLENVDRAIEGIPLWTWLSTVECGDRIGYSLLRADGVARPSSLPSERTWFSLGSPRVASDLGVSKSHVRNVINEAEARGYLRQDARNQTISLEASFFEETHRWFARTFALFGTSAARADATFTAAPLVASAVAGPRP